jgi:hypothetical protein
MLARVLSAAVNGIEPFPGEVETHYKRGVTTVIIVGLPDAAVHDRRSNEAGSRAKIAKQRPIHAKPFAPPGGNLSSWVPD